MVVGMVSMIARYDGWKKNGTDIRSRARSSPSGMTTRCSVETQRSLVQRAIRSPRFTTKPPGTIGTSAQSPFDRICNPGICSAATTVNAP